MQPKCIYDYYASTCVFGSCFSIFCTISMLILSLWQQISGRICDSARCVWSDYKERALVKISEDSPCWSQGNRYRNI